MRIHSQLAHDDLPPRAASTPTQFVPRLHACGGLPQCRLCLRTFYKWQNLKEHIESGACDRLGGESLTKHPVKADAQAVMVQPSNEDTPPDSATGVSQNVPLFERVRFAQQRHDWESLLRDPSLHSDLQSHCTLCHMWIASFRHVKQHICKVHEPETPGLHDKALALCLSFKQHLVRDHQCPWCKRKVWAPARHAQQCVVLYQLCVAKLRFQSAQDDGPLARPQSGSRHLRFLQPHAPSIKADQDSATPEGARSRGGAERGERIHTTAQEAAPRAKSVDGLSPVSNLKSSTTTPDAKGSEPLSGGKTHGKVDALSRGSTGGAADGQGLRPLHATGLCQHHPQPPRHFGGVARQERGGSRKPHLLAAHSAASMFGQGIARQGTENGLDPGGTRKTSTNKVDGPGSTVDFSSMVSQNQEARGRRQQAKPEPHGAGETAHILAREPPRRRDSQVSQHQRPGSGGGKCIQPSIRDLFAGHLPSGRTSSRDARGSVQAARLLSMAADRSLPKEGGSSESTSGQAIGQDALRQVSRDAATVPQLPGAILQVHCHPPHIPNFSLLNPGNHCYAISFLYSVDIAMHRAHQIEHSPAVLHCLQGCQRVKVFHHLGFLTLGWQEPERQHDVTEFIDFLHPKLFPRSFLGTWQGRSLDDDAALQRTEENSSSLCIGLGALPKHNPNVQSLLDHWYAQEVRQALMQKAPWLFLQLPRFRHQAGRITKAKQCYTLPVELKVPIFRDSHTMAVQWQPYSVAAFICHRGTSPSSGHYYVVTPGQRGYLALDDDKKPADVGADNLRQVSRDMYVIVLALSPEASHSVAGGDVQHDPHTQSQQEATAHTDSGHGFPLAEICGPPWRGMDCQSDLPTGSASPSDGSRHGNSAAAPQHPALSDFPAHAQPAPSGTAARVEKLSQQVPTNSAAD